jgi:hypothetical protein
VGLALSLPEVNFLGLLARHLAGAIHYPSQHHARRPQRIAFIITTPSTNTTPESVYRGRRDDQSEIGRLRRDHSLRNSTTRA